MKKVIGPGEGNTIATNMLEKRGGSAILTEWELLSSRGRGKRSLEEDCWFAQRGIEPRGAKENGVGDERDEKPAMIMVREKVSGRDKTRARRTNTGTRGGGRNCASLQERLRELKPSLSKQ